MFINKFPIFDDACLKICMFGIFPKEYVFAGIKWGKVKFTLTLNLSSFFHRMMNFIKK